MNEIKAGEVYEHYKKKTRYMVLSIAEHTENGEDLIIYQEFSGDGPIWARPKRMWSENVAGRKEENVPRFRRVG